MIKTVSMGEGAQMGTTSQLPLQLLPCFPPPIADFTQPPTSHYDFHPRSPTSLFFFNRHTASAAYLFKGDLRAKTYEVAVTGD